MRSKLRGVIIWLVIILVVGVSCIIIGYKLGQHNKTKCAVDKSTEVKEKEEKTDDRVDKRSAEELVEPFLSVNNTCDSKNTFIYKKTQKYENFNSSTAIQIALGNLTYEEWQEFYTAQKEEHEFDPENPEYDEYDDIETSYIKEKIAYTFGKDKTIKFPNKLDFWFENYTLKGDKYVLEAQGGGCVAFTDYIRTKVVKGSYNGDEYTVQVNFAYITYDVKENEDELDASITVYNNLDKKRVIVKDAKYGDNEEDGLDKLLEGDKTDYMLFTFKLEDDHYIFDKVEVIER